MTIREDLAKSLIPRINTFSSLVKLNLNRCNLGDYGAVCLSNSLSKNSTMTHLYLIENGISDVGAISISNMLRSNETLTCVILDKNCVGIDGQRALKEAIFDDSSFAAMKASNHVLSSYFYTPREAFGPEVMLGILSAHAASVGSNCPERTLTNKLKLMLRRKYRVKLHLQAFQALETYLIPATLGWVAQKCDLDTLYSLGPLLAEQLEGIGEHSR